MKKKPVGIPKPEYRKCYKAACHCMKGGKLHGPYYYVKRRDKKGVYSEYGGKR